MLALKPFLDELTSFCEKLSKENLVELLQKFAEDVPAKDREDFLIRIKNLSSVNSCKKEPIYKRDLISEIEGLLDDIRERMESIEDGSYYEDNYEYGDYGYDDDPDIISEEQKEELEEYFSETGQLFLSGNFTLAKDAYILLLSLFSPANYSFPLTLHDYDVRINLKEERARYFRCIYEAAEPSDRTDALLREMFLEALERPKRLDFSMEKYPLFQDIIDSCKKRAEGLTEFFKEWKNALEKKSGYRALLLYLESLSFLEGNETVIDAVRNSVSDKPVGYLYLLNLLDAEGDSGKMAKIALEALNIKENGVMREQIADFLLKAAKIQKDDNLILTAYKEKFYSNPADNCLANLLKKADETDTRKKIIPELLSFLEENKEFKSIYVKMLLISGNLYEAFQKTREGNPFGWSSLESSVGLVYGAVLYHLAREKGDLIIKILKEYAEKFYSRYSYFHENEDVNKSAISDEILNGVRSVQLENSQRVTLLAWVKETGKKRVEHIVDNKHRNAYGRAALAFGALLEMLKLSNDNLAGRELLHNYRNLKYSRYPAFKKELDSILDSSKVLRSIT